MGRNYYLCHGYNTNFYNCDLKKIIFSKPIVSLDVIDSYTSSFDNLYSLKTHLLEKGLIDDLEEDIVIGCNKIDKTTKKTRLVPIFLRDLIFKEDLDALNISGFDPYDIANKLWEYIKKRCNDKQFLNFIVPIYYNKYSQSKKKIPIFEDGSIGLLMGCLSSQEYANNNRREFEDCFNNLFLNELYVCSIKYNERGKMFIPNKDLLNNKGLHELLIRVIQYIKLYEPIKYYKDNYSYINQQDGDHEEFLEPEDFDRMINDYMRDNSLDKHDDYVKALIIEKNALFSKEEME